MNNEEYFQKKLKDMMGSVGGSSSYKDDEYFQNLFNNVTDDEGNKIALDEAERMVKEQIRQQINNMPTFDEDMQKQINSELQKMQMKAMEFYKAHPEKIEEHRKMHEEARKNNNSEVHWRKVDKAPEPTN